MNFNSEELIKDAAKEMKRVDKLKKKARQNGKRSKATVNFNKFGEKFGLNPNGYTFLDDFFSQILMYQMSEMFSNDEEMSYIELASKAFEATKGSLEKELGLAV